jgi:hypothetical protein
MINAIQFQVLESVEKALLGHAEYSAQYHFDIGKMREYSSNGECQVAQILKPGEADRFAVILSDPQANPSVGGWRFEILFKTNIGNVPGPEIEVWLPRPEVVRSLDEVADHWLKNAQFQSFITGNKFRKLTSRATDPTSPEGIAHSRFIETGGGALAYPSTTGGYETFVAYGMTLAFYRGPRPLWERSGGSTAEIGSGKPEIEAAKIFYQKYGADAPRVAEQWCSALAQKSNTKAVEKWKLVLEQVKLLIEKG